MSTVTTSSHRRPAGEHGPIYEIRSYRKPAKVFHWLTAILVGCMIALGVIAKQLDGDPIAEVLFSAHKLTGFLTFIVVLLRLIYRFSGGIPKASAHQHRRPVLHWLLYTVLIIVPLLGWAGVSDEGAREIAPGFSLPPLWAEGTGWDATLLHAHAYFAFGLVALIGLHIGVAIQDYMTDARPVSEDPD